jgi:hypothetical protein
MGRRVDIVLTDVSGEHISSIFRVEEKRSKFANEELTRAGAVSLLAPAHAGSSLVNFLNFSSTVKMEEIRSSEISGNTISTRRHIPQGCFLHSHRRENLRSYNLYRLRRRTA